MDPGTKVWRGVGIGCRLPPFRMTASKRKSTAPALPPAHPGSVLGADFFDRDTLVVARALIGCNLCRDDGGTVRRWRITEVEAYDGHKDKASHASRGRTARNAPMFGPAGAWYVYLCYGVHWMLNIVTREAGYPAAILIRGAGPCSGPGILTRELRVDKALDGRPATPGTGLWIEDDGLAVPDAEVVRTPRIGVAYAGPDWSRRPYRFLWRR